MTDQDAQQPPKRSSFWVTAVIISFILVMSAAFFWAGNLFYGIVMIAIPVLSIIISASCYIVHKHQPAVEQFVLGDVEFREPVDEDHRTAIADRPPDYRLTWRRSFMKRMKQLRQSHPNGRERDIEEGNEEEAAELGAASANSSKQRAVVQISSSSTESTKEVPPSEALPTYDEALEIIASRENLS